MREHGTMITCDTCGKQGYFIKDQSSEIYPEDWECQDHKDVCPDCVMKNNEMKNQINVLDQPYRPLNDMVTLTLYKD